MGEQLRWLEAKRGQCDLVMRADSNSGSSFYKVVSDPTLSSTLGR